MIDIRNISDKELIKASRLELRALIENQDKSYNLSFEEKTQNVETIATNELIRRYEHLTTFNESTKSQQVLRLTFELWKRDMQRSKGKERKSDIEMVTEFLHYTRRAYVVYNRMKSMSKNSFEFKQTTEPQMGYDTILSSGICDTCNVPKMVNSGDGIREPLNPVLFCDKMNTEIEPLPPSDRRTKCEYYAIR